MQQTRKDLGWAYELVEFGEIATIDRMMEEIDVLERLDVMISISALNDCCPCEASNLYRQRLMPRSSLVSRRPRMLPEGMFDSAYVGRIPGAPIAPDVRPQRLSAPMNVPRAPPVIATDDANNMIIQPLWRHA